MDIRWGYNKEGDEWKATFTCKAGLFEPTVMFFGLTNSPATFQAMMDDIIHDKIAQGWLKAYMDDILLCRHKIDCPTLVKRGLHGLKKLWEHDLFIKPEKCNLFVSRVEFLGFIIDEGTVQMDPTKVDGIVDWLPPQNLSELRSFVGFCNFYHWFIDHYLDKCQPLTTLTRKTQQWKWTNTEHTAFEILKTAYASKPVLMVADYDKAFEIEADASLFAMGAVLLQRDINGDQHLVAYYSKALTAPRQNYQTYDHEFLSIIRAL